MVEIFPGEIIIAAKNPNAEELKYEIADFLYHMIEDMYSMAESQGADIVLCDFRMIYTSPIGSSAFATSFFASS